MPFRDSWKIEILDKLADGVVVLDDSMQVVWCNVQAERMLGVSKGLAQGRPCREVVKVDRCEGECPLGDVFSRGGVPRSVEYKGAFRGSPPMQLDIRVVPFRSEDGALSGAVMSIRDRRGEEPTSRQAVEISSGREFQGIVSQNAKIGRIFELLPDISRSDASVLIQGESGTGKELFANAIHALSHRSQGPFIKINCSAFPDTLLESELFGYMKGAFTDAKRDKPGMFQLAHGGTLFLDEIAEISPALQVKLLRVVQDGEFIPLGGTRPLRVDVRIISATNKDLEELVAQNTFRTDLYYRLNVVKIHIPPLRERPEDIPILVHHLIERFRKKAQKPIEGISWEALEVLQHYDFPGNVRELENIIEHAFILCKDRTIKREHLPSYLFGLEDELEHMDTDSYRMQDLESRTILEVLRKHRGSKAKAARELGIHRTTLWRKLRRMGVHAT